MILPAQFNVFSQELRDEIALYGILKTIPKNVEIVHEGQYVQAIPIVLDGLLKVHIKHDDKEFLLYYIQPNESCIMSFYSVLNEASSKIVAQTETDTKILLLPSPLVRSWLKRFPEFSIFFLQLNNLRYLELLQTIQEVLFENLDKRILRFLQEKARQNKESFIKIRHREIADAMGTTREVISRVTKKMEHEKLIEQFPDGIEVRL